MSDEITREVVQALTWMETQPDSAAVFHAAVVNHLFVCGFRVRTEICVELPSGKGGRIDLVAYDNRGAVAIELDNRRPRRKSLDKLSVFDGGRVVVLRGVPPIRKPEGIDAIIAIPVRTATRREVSDKTAVTRTTRKFRGRSA